MLVACASSAQAQSLVYDSNTASAAGGYRDFGFTVQSASDPSDTNEQFFGDDYFTTFSDPAPTVAQATADRFRLTNFNFVGGAVQPDATSPTQQGRTLTFGFHEFTTNAMDQVTGIAPTPVAGFTVTLADFGIFNYSFDLAAAGLNVMVPQVGAVVLSTDSTTTGDFFVSGNPGGDATNPQVPVGFNFDNVLAFTSTAPDADGNFFPQLFTVAAGQGVLAFGLTGTVPEPATAGLASVAALGLLARRRRA